MPPSGTPPKVPLSDPVAVTSVTTEFNGIAGQAPSAVIWRPAPPRLTSPDALSRETFAPPFATVKPAIDAASSETAPLTVTTPPSLGATARPLLVIDSGPVLTPPAAKTEIWFIATGAPL